MRKPWSRRLLYAEKLTTTIWSRVTCSGPTFACVAHVANFFFFSGGGIEEHADCGRARWPDRCDADAVDDPKHLPGSPSSPASCERASATTRTTQAAAGSKVTVVQRAGYCTTEGRPRGWHFRLVRSVAASRFTEAPRRPQPAPWSNRRTLLRAMACKLRNRFPVLGRNRHGGGDRAKGSSSVSSPTILHPNGTELGVGGRKRELARGVMKQTTLYRPRPLNSETRGMISRA